MKLFLRALFYIIVGAAIGVGIGFISDAKADTEVYFWQTTEGSFFTDNEDAVPEDKVSTAILKVDGLINYKKFTPVDSKAIAEYAEGLKARLERLRVRNEIN